MIEPDADAAVSAGDLARLADIVEAVGAIQAHLARGGLDDRLVHDAVRVRLIEIGEAVDGLSDELLDLEPEVPWRAIARMRVPLAHRDFDPDHSIVRDVIGHELAPLLRAVGALVDRIDSSAGDSVPG